MADCCKVCVFAFLSVGNYRCHRYPPRDLGNVPLSLLGFSQSWPIVGAADWCGEFKEPFPPRVVPL